MRCYGRPRNLERSRMKQDVLLVGSIPLDTPEAVFREFGKPLGGALKTMPDGEVGPVSYTHLTLPTICSV